MENIMEETKPDIENEFAEFWINRGATKYLQTDRKTSKIVPKLKTYYVARARLKETGEEAFVIAGNGKVIFESKTYEAMCYECDKIKLLTKFKKELV